MPEIVVEDCIEARRVFALTGEAPHPDAVADQKMIESAVQRSEKGAPVGAIVSLRNPSRRLIKAIIAPRVIAGKHMIAGQHGDTPDQWPRQRRTDLAARRAHRYKPRVPTFQ